MGLGLDPQFLTLASKGFASYLTTKNQGKKYKITRNLRMVTLKGRAFVDVSADTATPVEKTLFLDPDPVSNTSGWVQRTQEPNFKAQNSTPSDTALCFLGHRWFLETQKLFGAAPTEVNSIVGIFGTADARISQGGQVVSGPISIRDGLMGEPSQRVSSATVAGELLGGVEDVDSQRWVLEPTPIMVPPNSTVQPVISFNGAEFATRTPVVTEDFYIYWEIAAIAANVVEVNS